MPTADLASSADARELAAGDLRAAQLLWATVDSPWIHSANTDRYFETVRSLRDIDPDLVLSTHLPPATGIDDQLFAMLAEAPEADPFVGPDQQALEMMLAGFEPAHV